MQDRSVLVVGAGLAGCEAAWQIAERGVPVRLVDMKPEKMTQAHHQPEFAELVCSNSLRSNRLENAVGLLKEELRMLGSLLLRLADETAVPAGGALAVDRERFATAVTQAIKTHSLITVEENCEIKTIPTDGLTIIATGPLTSPALFAELEKLLGEEGLHFFDASAPLVEADSLDEQAVFRQSRHGEGADYINCPMDQEQYEAFVEALLAAEKAEVHDFDRKQVFEGCMPIEVMASRGKDTLRFGPLKPMGLVDPRTGKRPWACVQLRQDDVAGTLYNIVGFQTRLKFPEQRRVFAMIPGLSQAKFARYGVMHRNSYIQSPGRLLPSYQLAAQKRLAFAGQLTGVEGYVESVASGFVAGINMALMAQEKDCAFLPSDQTVLGALAHYVSNPAVKRFDPMNANFGLLSPLPLPEGQKKWRKDSKIQAMIDRSLNLCKNYRQDSAIFPSRS